VRDMAAPTQPPAEHQGGTPEHVQVWMAGALAALQLSPREWQALRMYYVGNCCTREVAARMGITRGSARLYRSRAVKRLARLQRSATTG